MITLDAGLLLVGLLVTVLAGFGLPLLAIIRWGGNGRVS